MRVQSRLQKSIHAQLNKASGTPIPSIPELILCIVVAVMASGSVIIETACSHSHSPFQTNNSLSQNSLLVVQEALPFCTSVALISSKHLCFVH